jgi:hypothetical protein
LVRPRREPVRVAEILVPRIAATRPDDIGIAYRSRPSESVISRFLDHVRETGSPETFPTICRTTPPAESRPIFLRRFDIDRRKRPNGDMGPCPICSPNDPKFLHGGYLVWYPDEGMIRAIGPECGDAVFGGSLYADAKVQFDGEERERQAVEFLEKNLQKVLSMIVALEAIHPAAQESARLCSEFKRAGPTIQKVLRKIKSACGTLRVTIVIERKEDERVDGPRGFGKRHSDYDSYDITLGQLPDTALLHGSFDPLGEWWEIQKLLIEMPQFGSDEAAFSWICNQSERIENLERACDLLRDASRRHVKLCGKLDSALLFFSEELFQHLDQWGRHEANDFDLSAKCEAGVFRLSHGRVYQNREEVVLKPDSAKLLARGNWPGFER